VENLENTKQKKFDYMWVIVGLSFLMVFTAYFRMQLQTMQIYAIIICRKPLSKEKYGHDREIRFRIHRG